jgi:hypothetical protein
VEEDDGVVACSVDSEWRKMMAVLPILLTVCGKGCSLSRGSGEGSGVGEWLPIRARQDADIAVQLYPADYHPPGYMAVQ